MDQAAIQIVEHHEIAGAVKKIPIDLSQRLEASWPGLIEFFLCDRHNDRHILDALELNGRHSTS